LLTFFFSDNAADADIKVWRETLFTTQISRADDFGSLLFLDTEIKKSLTTSDVVAGQRLGFCTWNAG
jgi:hypothetical protein